MSRISTVCLGYLRLNFPPLLSGRTAARTQHCCKMRIRCWEATSVQASLFRWSAAIPAAGSCQTTQLVRVGSKTRTHGDLEGPSDGVPCCCGFGC